jgi:hypothetical protein
MYTEFWWGNLLKSTDLEEQKRDEIMHVSSNAVEYIKINCPLPHLMHINIVNTEHLN